ncbi:hypothetical protein [Bacteriovorax sp. DB6_IX]|nr:hypothetical protein [Bacteriovorax sp. DB6_IX]EQC51858.1 hypothetical protein M901_1680 [Bacteriovorax sp. DB6_IX]
MKPDTPEKFKKDLFDKMNLVQKNLNEKGQLSEEEVAFLLMSSILEEEG